MIPIVNGLETEFGEQLLVARHNADAEDVTSLMNEFGVRGHPSFVLVDANGRIHQTYIGPQDEAVLREGITAVLQK